MPVIRRVRVDMQLIININLDTPLILPINYNHILQSALYNLLSILPDYADFIHDSGYTHGNRSYKLFNFSQLTGKYVIQGRDIIFYDMVSLEVRSPQPLLINILKASLEYNGIRFGDKTYYDLYLELYDYTVEENELLIVMKSPVTIYSTDSNSGRTYYYSPDEEAFSYMIDENFKRKYYAYWGVKAYSSISIELLQDTMPRKIVTKYKGVYVNAWLGKYRLNGERKYLDFLYQTGLGSKNSQGFGMFSII